MLYLYMPVEELEGEKEPDASVFIPLSNQPHDDLLGTIAVDAATSSDQLAETASYVGFQMISGTFTLVPPITGLIVIGSDHDQLAQIKGSNFAARSIADEEDRSTIMVPPWDGRSESPEEWILDLSDDFLGNAEPYKYQFDLLRFIGPQPVCAYLQRTDYDPDDLDCLYPIATRTCTYKPSDLIQALDKAGAFHS